MDSPDETQAYPADQGAQKDQSSAPEFIGEVPEEGLGHGRGKAENRGQDAGPGEGELEFVHQEGEQGGEKSRIEIVDKMAQSKERCLRERSFWFSSVHPFFIMAWQ